MGDDRFRELTVGNYFTALFGALLVVAVFLVGLL